VTCTNEECKLHDLPFNPSPRFDYSQRRFGKDVLAKIGEYSIQSTTKLNAQHDTEILRREYDLPISSRTVARVKDDILILMTQNLEKVNYNVLYECIEEIKEFFQLPIIGFLSDMQSSIWKCMETHYPEIPHKYCTYHFSTNLWNHLENYANKIHRYLNKTVKGLYINTASIKSQIEVPKEKQKVSLKKLFAPLAKEI
jgi:hypothetical protein